jgi:hypothetical protein
MELARWKVEDCIDWSGMPSYRKPPVYTMGERPYAMLDYRAWKAVLAEQGGAKAAAKVAFTALFQSEGFSVERRAEVLKANRALHDGYLVSDDPEDWAYTDERFQVLGYAKGVLLDVGGTDTAPQVDHIIAQRLTGTNAYSNAQVLSAAYNNHKRTELRAPDASALAHRIFGGRLDKGAVSKVAARFAARASGKGAAAKERGGSGNRRMISGSRPEGSCRRSNSG